MWLDICKQLKVDYRLSYEVNEESLKYRSLPPSRPSVDPSACDVVSAAKSFVEFS
jgi:hypothetical protein